MQTWLRRIRGALGMGFTWAAAWFAAGFVPRWVLGLDSDLPFPILFGALGFIAGVTCSGLLVLTEGRRRFDQMSLPRFATSGALGGLLLSALFVRGASLGWGEVLAVFHHLRPCLRRLRLRFARSGQTSRAARIARQSRRYLRGRARRPEKRKLH